jgi:hypothetical protein
MKNDMVIIESPFRGDTERNTLYARRAMLDCIIRGEAPLCFHLLYPQCLKDADAFERELGFRLSFKWHALADLLVVYQDYGISGGMNIAISKWQRLDAPIEYRNIGVNNEDNSNLNLNP